MQSGPVNEVYKTILDDINEKCIQKAAIKTRGSVDPSIRARILESNTFLTNSVEMFFFSISKPSAYKNCQICFKFLLKISILLIRRGSEIKSQKRTTQREAITMGLYPLGITPFLSKVISINKGSSNCIFRWFHWLRSALTYRIKFDNVSALCPLIGYNVKPSKSWVILKVKNLENAWQILEGTECKITDDGRRHLEGVLRSNKIKNIYINE